MPVLRIGVDGEPVVAMPSDDYNIMGARIGGTRDEARYADLSVWGGVYGQGERDRHCIWLDDFELKVGQIVQVEFLDSAPAIGSGKPFQSAGLTEPPLGHSLEAELHDLAEEIRRDPWVRGVFQFTYSSSLATPVSVATEPAEYGFGFSVLWNDARPDQLAISLYAYTIENVEHQQHGRTLAGGRINLGQMCHLKLLA